MASTWVSSAFGEFEDFLVTPAPAKGSKMPVKRQRQTHVRRKQIVSNPNREKLPVNVSNVSDLWTEKYAPQDQSSVAVHKKKAADVGAWLERAFRACQDGHHDTAPVLLLTGPAGCGKTATVRVLAKEKCVEIQEWSNPTNVPYTNDDGSTIAHGEHFESQMSIFYNFLLRANKYPSLQIFGDSQSSRRIILVEDYPNVFSYNTSEFHEILRKYKQCGCCPLVFILSDFVSGESKERLLFPKPLKAQLGIETINFNPVAPTTLVRLLTKIASDEINADPATCKAAISKIATNSSGDVRGAINALQFTYLKQGKSKEIERKALERGAGKATKGGETTEKCSPDAVIKDTSLFLFRALGKILHCKRDASNLKAPSEKLPHHLIHHYRHPLLVDIEDVIDRCHLSGEMFTSYLHQNYLEFFADIDDVVLAADCLSFAEYLTTNWTSRSAQQNYASSLSSRGLMFYNSQRSGSTKSVGWKPLHKPQWFATNRKARENALNAKQLFRMSACTHAELTTQLLPFLHKTDVTLHDAGQINLIHELSRFPRYVTHSDALDEKDIASLPSEEVDANVPIMDSTVTGSQTQPHTTTKDNDILIEDYDDSDMEF